MNALDGLVPIAVAIFGLPTCHLSGVGAGAERWMLEPKRRFAEYRQAFPKAITNSETALETKTIFARQFVAFYVLAQVVPFPTLGEFKFGGICSQHATQNDLRGGLVDGECAQKRDCCKVFHCRKNLDA